MEAAGTADGLVGRRGEELKAKWKAWSGREREKVLLRAIDFYSESVEKWVRLFHSPSFVGN